MRPNSFLHANLFKQSAKVPVDSVEVQSKMKTNLAATTRETYSPPPPLMTPSTTTRLETQTTTNAGKLPMEILAASPFADTAFRAKIGIERWGWGLND